MSSTAEQSFPDNLPPLWKSYLSGEAQKAYFQKLTQFLRSEHRTQTLIYPARENVLRALQLVDYDQVRVVILGQDPYHGEGQAIGLSFGVPNALKPKPPSLQNIFKELASDLGVKIPVGPSDLTGWASQGVLLLNTVLTVRHAQAFSHREAGWVQFTDQVIRALSLRPEPLVFVLWGAAAQKKKALIAAHHYAIESPHPSPLSASRGFFGSRPFSRINAILTQKLHQSPIDWTQISQSQ